MLLQEQGALKRNCDIAVGFDMSWDFENVKSSMKQTSVSFENGEMKN